MYVVKVSVASDVVAALNFAKKWNVRVNVKNTGHNFPGRNKGVRQSFVSLWKLSMILLLNFLAFGRTI